MAQFKPQVTYMTCESLHDWRVGRHRVSSPFITKTFNTYAELKKALRDYILHNHISTDRVFVTRSRRGEWGEWFEKWELINGKPTITQKGWQ